MRFFVCLIGAPGRQMPGALMRRYEFLARRRGLPIQWQRRGVVAVLAADGETDSAPLVAAASDWVAAGTARLDNAEEVERWLGLKASGRSHLELILLAIARDGVRDVPHLLGDFAFVVANTVTGSGVAARDAFGVKKLYWTQEGEVVAMSSRGEALASGDHYDVQYLAEVLGMCVPSPGHTAYEGVRSLPPATSATIRGGALTFRPFWTAYEFASQPRVAMTAREAATRCRDLLVESVRLRLTGGRDTWAQLSGGIDSSSVASIAQWLWSQGEVAQGLAGTVTYVDTHGTGGDETAYSDAVAARWQLRNETIVNPPVWRDDESQPPCLDEPNASQMLYPRERRLSAVVKAAGGRVLLTGMAGDTLFTGTMFFFADWLVEGRLIAAGREMLRRAMIGRVSFWELAYRNAVLPLLPLWLQHRLVQDAGQVPPWLSKGAIRRYELRDRSYVDRCYRGRLGHKYADSVAAGIEMMAAGQTSGLLEDTLDVRHPFLYRPLVEFALRLPAEWCVVPQQRKQILRDAMRGLLPEIVRSRVGKGALHARLAESLTTERSLLDSLLEEPILASLGLIDPAGLRAFVRGAQQRHESRQRLHSAVHHTLAVEAWLQTRSGRWACGDGVNNDPQFQ